MQVDAAFRHAMAEARKSEGSVRDGLSFEQFMVMLRADSRDSLDQYDDRMGGSSHGGAPPGSCLASPGDKHFLNGTLLPLCMPACDCSSAFSSLCAAHTSWL